MRLLLIAVLAIPALAGCGLKGDLYLPPPEPPATEAPATTPDEEQEQPRIPPTPGPAERR
ncbi:MAG: lipoprotein [Gammaproteobacteria bacterium]|nr:lipoprotein [Gammaproteobacteria bacterium]